jgi:raffinose/stachyose/melibiose transport system substrate-binding protein
MSAVRISWQRIATGALVIVLSACTGARSTPTPAASSSSPGTASAGTGPSASPAAPTGALRYLVEQPEDPADLDPLKAHLKDFEKANEGITVTLDSLPL